MRRWPRDAEEWKRLLAKAAPWLAAAALIAAGVHTYKQKVNCVPLRATASR
jgi:glutamine synthetase